MRYLLILFLLLSMPIITNAESYITIEVNVGIQVTGDDSNWMGDVPIEYRAAYVKQFKNNTYITGGYSHLSNVLTGAPFNDKLENSLDRVFIGVGFKFDL